jgi:hypothetical protein
MLSIGKSESFLTAEDAVKMLAESAENSGSKTPCDLCLPLPQPTPRFLYFAGLDYSKSFTDAERRYDEPF